MKRNDEITKALNELSPLREDAPAKPQKSAVAEVCIARMRELVGIAPPSREPGEDDE